MMIDIQTGERGFVLINERPVKYLGAGRHRVGSLFKRVRVEKVAVSYPASLLGKLDDERLALVPQDDLQLITLAEHERAVIFHGGEPITRLHAGIHQVWTVDCTIERKTGAKVPLVRVHVYDTSAVEAPLLPMKVAALLAPKDYVEVTAPEGSVALRFVDGKLDAVLPAGRHAAWNTTRTVQLTAIDLRERLVHVTGQEVMTKDRVSLRLNVSASYRVRDAKQLALVARAPDEVLYLAVQLSARDVVTTRTLDELLAARDELAKAMSASVGERATRLGLELVELGVKDIVLPGDMRDLLNKVTAATKEAEANVILRREETAATRSLAQTAKLLGENPLLIRLKELEAYRELAGKVGKLHLVMGEGSLPTLHLK